MNRKQRNANLQLYQLMQKTQNNQLEKTSQVDSSNQKGSSNTKTSNSNKKEKNQKDNTYAINVNNVVNEYMQIQMAIIQKKKRNKKIESNEETIVENNEPQLNQGNVECSLENETQQLEHSITVNTNHTEKITTENSFAVPLNTNWDSLSLGTEMYDSLFKFKVNTPQVWYDPLVWNIIYAALPHDYTMPDPKFVNILRTATARELMKPVLSPNFNSFLNPLKDHNI